MADTVKHEKMLKTVGGGDAENFYLYGRGKNLKSFAGGGRGYGMLPRLCAIKILIVHYFFVNKAMMQVTN